MKTKLPDLNLGQYYLRTVCEADYLDYFEIGKDPLVVEHLTWGPYVRPKEALYTIREIFLKRPLSGLPEGYAIVDRKNHHKMIGMIDFHTYYPGINTAEVGYILHRDYWNRGIMTMCLKAVTKVGFEFLGLDKILVGHILANQASKQVILKCGYHYEYQAVVKMGVEDRIVMYYSLYRYEYERME